MRLFIEAHIADIHFGAMDPRMQYKILEEQFISKLRKLPNLDIVSINGDIFDHKFMVTSEAVTYANMFIHELVALCVAKDATLIILAGTSQHDAGQLSLFYAYMNSMHLQIVEDMKFIYVKGKKILIIPELYGRTDYNKFLEEFYDGCYMHGTFMGSIYGKDIPTLNSPREPIFCIEDFKNCLGPIIAGHVHKAGCFKEHFYYSGCPYRWKFGEEEDKGFLMLIHDIDSRIYRINFEPIVSFRYDTINLDDMLCNDPKVVIDYIKQKKAEGIHNIRVQFTLNEDAKISIIKSFFQTDPNIKIETNFKKDKLEKILNESTTNTRKFDFIFDKSASPYDKLARYINQCEGCAFITADELIKLVKEEL